MGAGSGNSVGLALNKQDLELPKSTKSSNSANPGNALADSKSVKSDYVYMPESVAGHLKKG